MEDETIEVIDIINEFFGYGSVVSELYHTDNHELNTRFSLLPSFEVYIDDNGCGVAESQLNTHYSYDAYDLAGQMIESIEKVLDNGI